MKKSFPPPADDAVDPELLIGSEHDVAANVQILGVTSVTKHNRMVDRRTHRAITLSQFLSAALFVSVCLNVIQGVTRGERQHYAQELRTGAFSRLTPLPPEALVRNPTNRPPPHYSQEFFELQDRRQREDRAWAASFLPPVVRPEAGAALLPAPAPAPSAPS